MTNPITLERISILKDTVKDMESEIHKLMSRREHLRSTYRKSNRYRKIVIYNTVCDIDEKIISCCKIKYQADSELYSLGVIK